MPEILCIVSSSQIDPELDEDYTYTFYTDGTYYCTGFSEYSSIAWWSIDDGCLLIKHNDDGSWSKCTQPDDYRLVQIIEFEQEMRKLLE